MRFLGGLVLVVTAVACAAAISQVPAALPRFEVASIKLHPGPINFSMDPHVEGRRMTGTASTLLDLIQVAYHVRRYQIQAAPGWAKTEHYDLEAEAPESEGTLSTARGRWMLQALLADRFHLAAHFTAKQEPAYALVVAKGGPKNLKPVAADAQGGSTVQTGASPEFSLQMRVTKGTMRGLADQLSVTAGRPVLDRTGRNGFYAFTLDWRPANATGAADSNVPDLYAALSEQLGLRLEPVQAPMQMLVIEHVERPSAN